MRTLTNFGFALLAVAGCLPVMAENTINLDSPVAMVVAKNACTNQALAVHGTAHSVVNVSINKNTPSLHLQSHINMQDVSATGLDDGAKYTVLSVNNTVINLNGLPPVEWQMTFDFGLIGQGQAPNMRIRMLVHSTVDENGNVTADFLKADIVCQQ
jgi:hypothetical protein